VWLKKASSSAVVSWAGRAKIAVDDQATSVNLARVLTTRLASTMKLDLPASVVISSQVALTSDLIVSSQNKPLLPTLLYSFNEIQFI